MYVSKASKEKMSFTINWAEFDQVAKIGADFVAAQTAGETKKAFETYVGEQLSLFKANPIWQKRHAFETSNFLKKQRKLRFTPSQGAAWLLTTEDLRQAFPFGDDAADGGVQTILPVTGVAAATVGVTGG